MLISLKASWHRNHPAWKWPAEVAVFFILACPPLPGRTTTCTPTRSSTSASRKGPRSSTAPTRPSASAPPSSPSTMRWPQMPCVRCTSPETHCPPPCCDLRWSYPPPRWAKPFLTPFPSTSMRNPFCSPRVAKRDSSEGLNGLTDPPSQTSIRVLDSCQSCPSPKFPPKPIQRQKFFCVS